MVEIESPSAGFRAASFEQKGQKFKPRSAAFELKGEMAGQKSQTSKLATILFPASCAVIDDFLPPARLL
jgi:hypothetical protein